jgi:hypothetical protein
MGKTSWIWVVIFALFLWTIFFGIAYNTIDPDFGWHLRVGRLLWQEGIPKTDPFSYTMPSFQWVDHGRLTDMAIARVYDVSGFFGLSVISASLTILALGIAIPVGLWWWSFVPLMLGAGVFVTRSGIRPQIEDWLILAILMRVVFNRQLWLKRRWLVPLGFALWANLHGGFVMGLGVMSMAVVLHWWEKRKLVFKDFAVIILSILATLINPYGTGLWHEVWLTLSDSHLRSSISEWMPFYTKVELGMWLLTAMIFAVVKTKFHLFSFSRMVVLAVLFLAGLSSLRNAPLYILVAAPMVAEWMKSLWDSLKNNAEAMRRAKIFYGILLVIAFAVFAVESGVPFWKITTGRWIRYPEAAVQYINNNKFEGRLFSSYGWGGYLIWKLPNEKVFIDGRMPSWRWSAPEGESDWAFKDYEIIIKGDYKELFEKYNIQMVLWNKEVKQEEPSGWLIDLFVKNKQETAPFAQYLREDGWTEVYADDLSVIYKKAAKR